MVFSNNSKKLSLPKLLLTSTSARRRQILDSVGLSYELKSPQTEEKDAHRGNLARIVKLNAQLKAQSIGVKKNQISLGADTLVAFKSQVLAKPRDREEALAMLSMLSGQIHEVYTGVCLWNGTKTLTKLAKSLVHMKKFTKKELQCYLNTREPYDKSGSYAVQGLGSLWIKRIEGSYTNVMGLPVETLLPALEEISEVSLETWFR